MTKLKFQKQPVSNLRYSDFWEELSQGYIDPDIFLEPESSKVVKQSLAVLQEFKERAEDRGLLVKEW